MLNLKQIFLCMVFGMKSWWMSTMKFSSHPLKRLSINPYFIMFASSPERNENYFKVISAALTIRMMISLAIFFLTNVNLDSWSLSSCLAYFRYKGLLRLNFLISPLLFHQLLLPEPVSRIFGLLKSGFIHHYFESFIELLLEFMGLPSIT